MSVNEQSRDAFTAITTIVVLLRFKARTEGRTKTDVPVPGIVVAISLSYSAMKDSLGSPFPKLVLVSFYHLAASAVHAVQCKLLARRRAKSLPVDLCVKALQESTNYPTPTTLAKCK